MPNLSLPFLSHCTLLQDSEYSSLCYTVGHCCLSIWYVVRQWHPTPVLLPGKSHGWRSLVGCSPWGCKESDTTERLHIHFSLSCIGEGHGNPLQGSCLENPRDGGAWWAAVHGVTQSRTRLKQLSSSSSSSFPGGTVVKNPPANAGDSRDTGSIPGSRRSPRVWNGNPP